MLTAVGLTYFCHVRKKNQVLTDVEFIAYGALGKVIAKPEGKVLFAEGAVPGDVADVLLTKSKKDWAEGRILKIKKFSEQRVEPFCEHFGVCGGCKWQMLPYEQQLQYKEQETKDTFRKAGIHTTVMPIVGSDSDRAYRNKLEFSFSNKEFIPSGQFVKGASDKGNALGYHVPRLFDKVIDIHHCYLMDSINNEIRNSLRDFALEKNYAFYDLKNHEGWLRNLIIRYTTLGECLVNIIVASEDKESQKTITDFLIAKIPRISTLLFTINSKLNSSIYDLEPQVFHGRGFIYERLGDLKFKISPKSFFQTNSYQAKKLYDITKEFASLTGKEIVYDLYCGTGTIGLYVGDRSKKIIGVETVEDAIADAQYNATLNNISHASFFAGDVIKICNEEFFAEHGKPDVVILDPPRAGLHEKLVNRLMEIQPGRMVYVSCNIATQARDLNLFSEKYEIKRLQPVDMFPQTHHIECVAELVLRK